jgi:hypothetical protein
MRLQGNSALFNFYISTCGLVFLIKLPFEELNFIQCSYVQLLSLSV